MEKKTTGDGAAAVKSVREMIEDALDESPSAADALIIASRKKLLSAKELGAFVRNGRGFGLPKVYPYVGFERVGEGKKKETVVYLGVKGSF